MLSKLCLAFIVCLIFIKILNSESLRWNSIYCSQLLATTASELKSPSADPPRVRPWDLSIPDSGAVAAVCGSKKISTAGTAVIPIDVFNPAKRAYVPPPRLTQGRRRHEASEKAHIPLAAQNSLFSRATDSGPHPRSAQNPQMITSVFAPRVTPIIQPPLPPVPVSSSDHVPTSPPSSPLNPGFLLPPWHPLFISDSRLFIMNATNMWRAIHEERNRSIGGPSSPIFSFPHGMEANYNVFRYIL